MRLLAATFFSAALVCANDARASDLSLQWRAPAGCPGLVDLRAALCARQKRPVEIGVDAPIQIDAVVTPAGPDYRLDLRTRTESAEEERHLDARSCNELARVTVLIASLLLSTPAASSQEREASPVQSSTVDRGVLHLALAAVADWGRLPAPAAGMVARIGVDRGDLRLRAGALYMPTRDTDVLSEPGAHVSLQLWAAEVSACYALVRAPRLSPCVFGEIGSLRAAGHGLAHNEQGSSPWLLAGLGGQLSVALLHWLDVEGELTLGVPLFRTQLSLRDAGPVHRVPAVAGQLRVGLVAYFP